MMHREESRDDLNVAVSVEEIELRLVEPSSAAASSSIESTISRIEENSLSNRELLSQFLGMRPGKGRFSLFKSARPENARSRQELLEAAAQDGIDKNAYGYAHDVIDEAEYDYEQGSIRTEVYDSECGSDEDYLDLEYPDDSDSEVSSYPSVPSTVFIGKVRKYPDQKNCLRRVNIAHCLGLWPRRCSGARTLTESGHSNRIALLSCLNGGPGYDGELEQETMSRQASTGSKQHNDDISFGNKRNTPQDDKGQKGSEYKEVSFAAAVSFYSI